MKNYNLNNMTIEKAFLKSALTLENSFISTKETLKWLDKKKRHVHHKITPIKFSAMEDWCFDKKTNNLRHVTGKFFSIDGIKVKTNWGTVNEWSQPIINQPEIGFLGILTKKFDGVLHFLMQAKIEPGNINSVQISPTLQATKSNYTQVHKGNLPRYLEYFLENRKDTSILLDQLQSEQGARFLRKRNRNIIIEIDGEIQMHPDFCWLTLGQIKQLLTYDNVINMDTRTVISGIPYGGLEIRGLNNLDNSDYERSLLSSELNQTNALHSTNTIISWITNHKFLAELIIKNLHLNDVSGWDQDESSIFHKERKYFSVIAVRAEIGNREVNSWTQPLVKSAQEGVIAFIIKKINGIYHFLIQAKLECGNFDIIELAPTIQCLTGNYRKGESEYDVKYIEYAINPEKQNAIVRHSTFQSEEGGRFYQEQNKNMIIEVGKDFDLIVPDKYIWMSLSQIKLFIKFNNYLNIQSRSLLSTLRFI